MRPAGEQGHRQVGPARRRPGGDGGEGHDAAAQPARGLDQEARFSHAARAQRVGQPVGGAQRETRRRHRLARRFHRHHRDLGEAPHLHRRRRHDEHAAERRRLKIDLRLAHAAVVVDGAGQAHADAGRHLHRHLDVPLPVGGHGAERPLKDPQRDRGARAAAQRDLRHPEQRKAGRAAHALASGGGELHHEQRHLREALGRRQVARHELAGGGAPLGRLQRPDGGEDARGRVGLAPLAGDVDGDVDLLVGAEHEVGARGRDRDLHGGLGARRRAAGDRPGKEATGDG